MSVSKVFIALQTNEETRSIVEAIERDNPEAVASHQPAMIKIDCPGSMVIRRETVSELMGREFDLQELHVHMITISGHVDEDEEELTLRWH